MSDNSAKSYYCASALVLLFHCKPVNYLFHFIFSVHFLSQWVVRSSVSHCFHEQSSTWVHLLHGRNTTCKTILIITTNLFKEHQREWVRWKAATVLNLSLVTSGHLKQLPPKKKKLCFKLLCSHLCSTIPLCKTPEHGGTDKKIGSFLLQTFPLTTSCYTGSLIFYIYQDLRPAHVSAVSGHHCS